MSRGLMSYRKSVSEDRKKSKHVMKLFRNERER
uniref:S-phase cyclin A associated protein in the ER n=1 Tax=Rousettus aegyptiacus TaxID=9407 RepID=A0A7J8CLF4_ROUAE|nr:S-phase cyclin A associated protein in the ER [Rousettus aegyptiacus]